jgi:hypothetical protein
MKKEFIKQAYIVEIILALTSKRVSFSDVDEELFKCGRTEELDFIGDWLAEQELKQKEEA